MTVIAYKDKILATDTATFMGNLLVGYHRKIEVTDKVAWAACGLVSESAAFSEWAREGFPKESRPPKSDNFGAIVVYRNGSVWKCGETFILYDVTHYDAPVVEGASVDFLMGVMIAGKSARFAIELALKHCAWAGGVCSAFDVEKWKFVP